MAIVFIHLIRILVRNYNLFININFLSEKSLSSLIIYVRFKIGIYYDIRLDYTLEKLYFITSKFKKKE